MIDLHDKAKFEVFREMSTRIKVRSLQADTSLFITKKGWPSLSCLSHSLGRNLQRTVEHQRQTLAVSSKHAQDPGALSPRSPWCHGRGQGALIHPVSILCSESQNPTCGSPAQRKAGALLPSSSTIIKIVLLSTNVMLDAFHFGL